ncbi:protein FAR1-RELATED SEQUENCE 5-like [Olea europaea var. sylvestris]|uniref:protein FAR1-RELATED SEQUENCE 5-like n=1 Tax=Olea europaea var. sylvestris TaxID=158386 RepID=UPI000C1D015D|nr:protein FAR1-RELATED SEQUENCE 5-like [Olea europaea var. sylvestris]
MSSDICRAIMDPSSDNLEHEVTVVAVADAREVEEGRVFRNKEIMKLSLSFYAIQNMFEYVVVRFDKKDYLVKCTRDECNWICRASKLAKTDMFKIRHIAEGHICASNIVLSTHRQVAKTVVSTCIKYKYTSSRTIYTPNDIRNDMLHTYGVSLNYVQAWRSREETLKVLRGDPTDSFNKIPAFFFVIQQTNPGSVTCLEIDGHNRFKYYFMALGASIRGWKHCRPVVVVDSTYLNGHYGDTLFTACTQYANNSIYVLAFGIGDNENDSSWTWFFRQLRKAYGDRDSLCFVSDRHNSIKKAIENVYLGACHRICSYHLLQNLKSRYGRSGQNITQAFNAAVRTYTLLEYEYYMQQLGSINQKIRGYLVLYYMLSYDDIHINTFNMDKVGPERWSRIHMPSNRYSTMTSNIVESINAVTKSAKNYPILALLESLRQILQSWFCRHKEDAQGTFTTLSIKYEKKMREMSTDIRNLRVSPINQAMFSVSGESSSFVVDIENRTCICRMLQVDQLPCPHALAVFASMKMDPYEYCSYYYTSEAFRNTYQETIFSVGNPAEWTVPNDVHDIVVIAPNQKRSCGRPTEKRFRAAYEENITVKCGRCGESGHNRRTCSSLVPLSQSNKNKERRMMKDWKCTLIKFL